MENKKLTRSLRLSIIVAMSPNHAIGFRGSLPWHIPEDLAHFRELTTGHTVIMGRKTFESLPQGALADRRNIVLSHSLRQIPGCDVFSTLEGSLESCSNATLYRPSGSDDSPKKEEAFIIGGASVYSEALPYTDRLYITLVENNPVDADTFFPNINSEEWIVTNREKHMGFEFIELERKQKKEIIL